MFILRGSDKGIQKQPPEVFYKKGVLKNFTKFTGKHLYQSLFLIKLQASDLQLYGKETLAQVFSCEFCEIFKNTFFTGHLWATASGYKINFRIIFEATIPTTFE